jgi:predicted AlkP superfamily pyrophosphatase or phosphodiesterase
MHKTVVINAVGLTPSLIGENTPRLRAFRDAGRMVTIDPVLPAVTCSVQATYLTGAWPDEHGIVGNGWYFHDDCEIRFWRQSAALVQCPRVWDIANARDPSFTCANLFWWFNMYASADIQVTPRPMYPADGRKIPDLWTHPASLRDSLQRDLGQFPLFSFWGPGADLTSTRWITECAIRVDGQHDPTLTLVYLPHLDYDLQRHGPNSAQATVAAEELDEQAGRLIDHFSQRGARIIILSEYGIEPVDRPVHLNRVLREHGLLSIRRELGGELLDPGASTAFAVADHQVAHVYVNDRSQEARIRQIIEKVPGVARVYAQQERAAIHLDHQRAGDLVVLAEHGSWFTYYYWLDETRRPDFASTVDIHRKPGYDPAELLFDRSMRAPRLRVMLKLLARKVGMRSLLNVIGTDARVIHGSHGLPPKHPRSGPCMLTDSPDLVPIDVIQPTNVSGIILEHLSLNG